MYVYMTIYTYDICDSDSESKVAELATYESFSWAGGRIIPVTNVR